MVDVSFLLATSRCYDNFGSKVVDSIFEATNTSYSFEILTASPERINDSRVVSYIDSLESKFGVGGDSQYNYLASLSYGKYLAVITDCTLLPKNYFCLINFLKSPFFQNRKYKITSPCTNKNYTYPECERPPSFSQILKKTSFYKVLDYFRIICFPIMTRDTYCELGEYIFHPHLRHASDWYLSFFLTQNDEEPTHLEGVSLKFINKPNILYKDLITGALRHEYKFGEWYINLYKLMCNYKKGEPYVCNKEPFYSEDYLIKNWINPKLFL